MVSGWWIPVAFVAGAIYGVVAAYWLYRWFDRRDERKRAKQAITTPLVSWEYGPGDDEAVSETAYIPRRALDDNPTLVRERM